MYSRRFPPSTYCRGVKVAVGQRGSRREKGRKKRQANLEDEVDDSFVLEELLELADVGLRKGSSNKGQRRKRACRCQRGTNVFQLLQDFDLALEEFQGLWIRQELMLLDLWKLRGNTVSARCDEGRASRPRSGSLTREREEDEKRRD